MNLRIGRAADNDIVIDDPSVSRAHAVLVREGEALAVQDLHSTNGTFINGKKVNGTATLDVNDILKVGNSIVPWKNYVGHGSNFRTANVTTQSPLAQNEIAPMPSTSSPGSGAFAKTALYIVLGALVALAVFFVMQNL